MPPSDRFANGIVGAVRQLTRIPIGGSSADRLPARSLAYFPAVGLLVAAVSIATRAALAPLVGLTPATLAAVLVGVLVTGALHEDGLADTADGLWGGATTERRLEIMRDSRLGTYGVVALLADLGLRTTLLAGLGAADFARAVSTAHVLGRLTPLALLAMLPPARPDGQGARVPRPGPLSWTVAAGTAVATAAVATGVWAPAVLAAAAVAAAMVAVTAHRCLGGQTGDVLGAGVAVTGLAVIATVVGVSHAGGW